MGPDINTPSKVTNYAQFYCKSLCFLYVSLTTEPVRVQVGLWHWVTGYFKLPYTGKKKWNTLQGYFLGNLAFLVYDRAKFHKFKGSSALSYYTTLYLKCQVSFVKHFRNFHFLCSVNRILCQFTALLEWNACRKHLQVHVLVLKFRSRHSKLLTNTLCVAVMGGWQRYSSHIP